MPSAPSVRGNKTLREGGVSLRPAILRATYVCPLAMATPPDPTTPSRDLADAALRIAKGDRAAFELVHRRLDPGLRRLLSKRTPDSTLIDDLLQRTWAGVWEACAAGRYDPTRSAISTFVYAVASNTWLRHLRGVKKTDPAAPDELSKLSDPETADAASLAETLDLVRQALDGRFADLTEQERWILRMSSDGAGDRTIASRLGISPSTANQAKQSAFGKLRRILARVGVRPEAAERGPVTRE